jgi:hypothetical protein
MLGIDPVAACKQRNDAVIAANQTVARTVPAGEDNTLVFRPIARAVRIPNPETDEAAD